MKCEGDFNIHAPRSCCIWIFIIQIQSAHFSNRESIFLHFLHFSILESHQLWFLWVFFFYDWSVFIHAYDSCSTWLDRHGSVEKYKDIILLYKSYYILLHYKLYKCVWDTVNYFGIYTHSGITHLLPIRI